MMHWAIAVLLAVSTPGTEPPVPEDVMAVPPELRAQLHDRVIGKGRTEQQRLDLLVDFVFGEHGLALTYGAETTETATQTYRSGKVNCLSFSLLFVALAREAGLRADLQEIGQALVWYKQGGNVYASSHVNVGVRIGGHVRTVDVSRTTVIARQRPKLISDRRAMAHFYNNRGAELMAAGERDAADRHMRLAMAFDPEFPSSWNNFGVLSLRNDDLPAAERAYANTLALDPEHSAALFNIIVLYQRLGDRKRVAEFQRRLEKAQLADPFHQFLLAMEYEGRGEHARAAGHYRRAIRLHGDEGLFHFGLARTYFAMGDDRRGRRSLARAHALSDDDTRDLSQARLQRVRPGAK